MEVEQLEQDLQKRRTDLEKIQQTWTVRISTTVSTTLLYNLSAQNLFNLKHKKNYELDGIFKL